jgi:hypothetical protein
MAINVFPVPSSAAVTPTGWTAGVAGTFTLSSTLTVGTYLIKTDSSQTMTITLVDSGGRRYAGTVRGGSGFITVATAVNQIIIPGSLTYPFGIEITPISVTQLAAPTSTSLSVASTGLVTGTWGTAPAGATGAVLFTAKGTVLNFSSTTSGATVQTSVADVTLNTTNEFVVAFKNSSGAIGIGSTVSLAIPASFDIIADILIVAGGGSSSSSFPQSAGAGGGGAGGYRTFTSSNIGGTGTTISVVVGAGGAGGSGASGANGGTSTFGTNSSSGGGKGYAVFPAPGSGVGSAGGSGGAGTPTGASGNSGGYSPVEGYAGVTGNGGGSAGTNGSGTANSITGASVTYAAGGTSGTSGTSGTANTGNGGSGATNASPSSVASGGSGVVIIAYSDAYPAITTIPGTLTYNEPTRAGYRVYRFTAGSGTITL